MQTYQADQPKEAYVQQVIVTNLLQRGNGTTTTIRRVTQVFTTDGELIAEHDPCPDPVVVKSNGTYTAAQLESFARYLAKHADDLNHEPQHLIKAWIATTP